MVPLDTLGIPPAPWLGLCPLNGSPFRRHVPVTGLPPSSQFPGCLKQRWVIGVRAFASAHKCLEAPSASLCCAHQLHIQILTNSCERSPASPSVASCTLSHALMVISSSLRVFPSFPPPRMSSSAHLEACIPTSSPDSAERF